MLKLAVTQADEIPMRVISGGRKQHRLAERKLSVLINGKTAGSLHYSVNRKISMGILHLWKNSHQQFGK